MFNIPVLDVAIGMIFIYLLLSLIVTAAQEVIASLSSMRGSILRDCIGNMLEDAEIAIRTKKFRITFPWKNVQPLNDDTTTCKFYSHPIMKRFSFKKSNPLPSYIEDKLFVDILKDVITEFDADNIESVIKTEEQYVDLLKDRISKMKESGLKKILQKFISNAELKGNLIEDKVRAAQIKLATFDENLKEWYNNTMDRISGYYKRNTQAIVLFIGLFVAMVLNADSLHMISILSSDKSVRNLVVAQAIKYANENPDSLPAASGNSKAVTIPVKDSANAQAISDSMSRQNEMSNSTTPENSAADDSSFQKRIQRLHNAMNDPYFKEVNQTIGLGWGPELATMEWPTKAFPKKNIFCKAGWYAEFVFLNLKHPGWVLQKIFGWLITALAISLGAPFWFDLLKKMINIRGSGAVPADDKGTKDAAQKNK